VTGKVVKQDRQDHCGRGFALKLKHPQYGKYIRRTTRLLAMTRRVPRTKATPW
jgi:ribosomal protein S17